MAVQKMKLVNITGPVDKLDYLLFNAFKEHPFQPQNALNVIRGIKGLFPFDEKNPYQDTLSKVCALLDLAGIKYDYRPSDDELTAEQIDAACDDISAELKQMYSQRDALDRDIVKKTQSIRQIEPFRNIDIDLKTLLNFEHIKFRFGSMPKESYDRYTMYISEYQNVMYFPSFTEGNLVWGMYFTPRSNAEEIDSVFASLHFERQRISDEVDGTPAHTIETMRARVDALKSEVDGLNKKIDAYIASKRDTLLTYYSKLRFLNDSFDIRKYAAHTEKSFYLVGFVPEDDVESFISQFSSEPDIVCVSESPDEKQFAVPTSLKNPGIFRPFEQFVTMYGVPSYNEFDPTPLFAVTYCLLFGIMFGDIGQGLVLVVVGLFMAKSRGINLGYIIASVGVCSTLMGFVYGSIFGVEDLLPGFKPLENSDTIGTAIFVSVAFGAILITVVMIINIINGIRQKNVEKVLLHFNGAAGLVFYWGVVIAVLGSFGVIRNVLSPVYILIFIAVPLIAIYLKEPLSKLIAKRKDWKPKNPGEFFVENFFELFEVLLSYITNTISFVRVGAFAINHAGMMLAVFIIADMMGSAGSIAVKVFGNILVIGLEGLIVGIQVLRLEFYELFSRFFSAEGTAFNPIKIQYNKNVNGGI